MLKLLDKFLSKSQSPFSLKTLFHWSVVIHDFFVRFDHGAVTSFIRCLAPIFRICLKNIRLTGGSTILRRISIIDGPIFKQYDGNK